MELRILMCFFNYLIKVKYSFIRLSTPTIKCFLLVPFLIDVIYEYLPICLLFWSIDLLPFMYNNFAYINVLAHSWWSWKFYLTWYNISYLIFHITIFMCTGSITF